MLPQQHQLQAASVCWRNIYTLETRGWAGRSVGEANRAAERVGPVFRAVTLAVWSRELEGSILLLLERRQVLRQVVKVIKFSKKLVADLLLDRLVNIIERVDGATGVCS